LSKFEIFSNFNCCNINWWFTFKHKTIITIEKLFLHQFAVDFIENHLVDVIFQKEISLLLEYF